MRSAPSRCARAATAPTFTTNGTIGSFTVSAGTAGGNDVQFQLPSSLRLRLRTQAATSNVLTLTSLSASGATGQVVKRRVAIDSVKPKSKRKTKRTRG
jgi:hypothetical protein